MCAPMRAFTKMHDANSACLYTMHDALLIISCAQDHKINPRRCIIHEHFVSGVTNGSLPAWQMSLQEGMYECMYEGM